MLKDKWISGVSSDPKQTLSQYVENLVNTLSKVRKSAMEDLGKSQKKMKSLYDVKAKMQHHNQRIFQWALQIQPYRLEIKHIKVVDNVIAVP
ncbi:hypothetical protein Pmani_010678 [Petrolisthes manimaculis]|uniref:Uncharacterized protein n=1 Tax=Petrolisthes manimaculis TaxID=1843537 RepID=A0AAE1Q4F9_9EUCA|nr:hypothetical protein Pmani_010678 [Petrolisthes manimaculis]